MEKSQITFFSAEWFSKNTGGAFALTNINKLQLSVKNLANPGHVFFFLNAYYVKIVRLVSTSLQVSDFHISLLIIFQDVSFFYTLV